MFKRILIYTFLIVIFTFSGMKSYAQMPVLVDRELFFGNPEIAGAQISPDGKYIAFIKPLNDVRNVWVKGVNDSFDKAKPLTEATNTSSPFLHNQSPNASNSPLQTSSKPRFMPSPQQRRWKTSGWSMMCQSTRST